MNTINFAKFIIPWTLGCDFDLPMDSYDGSEIYELVGLS